MVLHIFAFTYRKSLFLLLREMIHLFTAFNSEVEAAWRPCSSPLFFHLTTPHVDGPSAPAGWPASTCPVQPSSFIFHAHFLLGSQYRKRRVHWISNFSSWRTLIPPNCHLLTRNSSRYWVRLFPASL